MFIPVDFNSVGPGCDSIMATECKAGTSFSVEIKPGPSAHPRAGAVGSNDPPRPDSVVSQLNAIDRNPGHNRLPQEMDAQGRGMLNHQCVQSGSPQAQPAGSTGESRINFQIRAYET